jgi:hypothetical protein
MNFLAEHFWKLLLLAAIAFGGNVYYKKYQQEQDWARSTRTYADLLERLRSAEPEGSSLEQWEGDFWRLMLRTDEMRDQLTSKKLLIPRDKNEVDQGTTPNAEKMMYSFLKAAGLKTGYPADLTAKGSASKIASNDPVILFTEVVAENYTILSDCGVWEDPGMRAGMAKGEAPIIKVGPYAGEKLALVRRISPHLFRGGITEPCNIVILPESAAALYFPEVDDTMLAFSQRMSYCGLIDSKSAAAVKRLHAESSKR